MRVVDRTKQPRKIIEIVDAHVLDGHRLSIEFKDGTKRIVDLTEFLQSAHDATTRKYLNPRKFKQFKIRHGNLNWNGYEMCFPVADLYRGRVI